MSSELNKDKIKCSIFILISLNCQTENNSVDPGIREIVTTETTIKTEALNLTKVTTAKYVKSKFIGNFPLQNNKFFWLKPSEVLFKIKSI